MIFVGIDVAKSKHDCFIADQSGTPLEKPFSFPNSKPGFLKLMSLIHLHADDGNVKVGLEATGHYGRNLLHFLAQQNVQVFLVNPLQTSLFRKSSSLRKAKTDPIDARALVKLLIAEPDLKPYSPLSYTMDSLKSLTRYRFRCVRARAKAKAALSRIVVQIFPELESLVPSIHCRYIYSLLKAYPDVEKLAKASIASLTRLIAKASRNRHGKQMAKKIQQSARESIGYTTIGEQQELLDIIEAIERWDERIKEIDEVIEKECKDTVSPLLSIPGIGLVTGSGILAELGNFARFSDADKALAYAGMVPSIYQSGQYISSHAKIEKRGSKYLRYALYNAAASVIRYNAEFKKYAEKKKQEGKHYFVVLIHVARKLLRVMMHLMKTGKTYMSQAA